MDNTERLIVYQAQCANVRSLVTAFRQTKRCLNESLRKNRDSEVISHTKVLALIFCAWSEANFSKTIHTPHGFTLDEINQIKAAMRTNGISQGWKNCIVLAMKKTAAKKSNFGANAKQALQRLVDELVVEPSILRNKIAHGQWAEPLNRANNNVNIEVKNMLDRLDSIAVESWFERQKILSIIIELLIESPNNAFMKTYWNFIEAIDEIKSTRSAWTNETKVDKLKVKRL